MGAIRIIAVSRLILASYWVLALILDPGSFPESRAALAVVVSYAAYSLVRAFFAWRESYSSRKSQVARHVIDMSVFALLSLLTNGSMSPFFLGFTFSLVCATLLFDMRGMIATAAGALLIYMAVTFLAGTGGDFTLYRFIVRTGFLASIAALLIQLKLHEERLQNDYRKLAGWPRGSMLNLRTMITDVLHHATILLRVPRTMLLWEDERASVLHVAIASRDGVTFSEEPSWFFEPAVDRTARLKSFVSTKWLRSPAARSETSTKGLELLRENPIHPQFRERFGINHVVASRFTGESVSGWIFALDKDDLTEDDLVMTDIVAGLVESRLEQFYLAAAVSDTAITQERIRFARDLHDGILQSLTGTALHLRCLRHLIENDVQAALFSLGEVQEALQDDQREVRSFIMKLRSAMRVPDEPQLGPRLTALAERIQRDWGLKVTMEVTPLIEIVAPGMAEEVHRVVKEALTNAAIHSNASRVSVEVNVRNERVRIIVEDNGRGFRFTGTHTLSQLTAAKRGPVTLKERVNAVGGDLIIHSSQSGARLEIDLPFSLADVAVP